MKQLVAIVALLFMAGSSANAGDSLFGDAGNDRCGLGSMIWSGNSISSQTSEASSNNLMYNELFSVTTGTSGCSNSGIVKANEVQLHYASFNLEEIRTEMAQGKGEVLAGLGYVMGCHEGALNNFSQMTQKNYQAIFGQAQTTPAQLLNNVKQQMSADPVLAAECKI